MSQNWVVGLIVGLAALYSVWYVLPRAARQRLGRIHSALGRAPACGSSCSRCDKCPGTAAGGGAHVGSDQEHPVNFHHQG